jgi:hypothetical protein
MEACEEWVNGFNAIPLALIEKAYGEDIDAVSELTLPAVGDNCSLYSSCRFTEYAEVKAVNYEEREAVLEIDGDDVTISFDEFEVVRNGFFPMWGTLWTFGDSCDEYWVTDMNGLAKMTECGFRVYQSEELGIFFGIDGAGYSFYDQHWLPLYNARGLQWHDKEGE